jgi:hypothetical protein
MENLRFCRGDIDHLIVESVQDALVDFCALRGCGRRKIVLDLFFEPVVCICNVSGMDHELIAVNHLRQRGNGGLLIDCQRVCSSSSNHGTQTESTKGTHVDNNTHCVGCRIARRTSSSEGIGSRSIAVLRKVIISRVWQQTSEIHVIIVRQGSCVGNGDGGRSSLRESA